ncbi:hypothetical protein QN277_024849 [Acacia crassicarpa]|uniref:Uncharacterized protein n=1 Tax=Acacia crassicarpa TaxID=499986 RepID=A0AAE1KA70_9FABA|nr:hypothetical protein QN277_024849 [Acacia crassicarpa]
MAPPSLSKSSPDFTTHVNGFNPSPFHIKGPNLLVNDHVVLSDVPENVTATPCSYSSTTESLPTTGCFIGFDAAVASSRHVVPIGKLKNIRFMTIFRFKVWWTTHWIGSNGRELETETQIIILDKSNSGHQYVLILPILEGQFRASIQPGQDDNIDVCIENGSSQVKGNSYCSVVYLHVSEDPFSLVKEAIKIVRAHLNTFNLLDEKTPLGIIEKFG